MDPRPENCRFRLQDEGKGYPRSSCSACGKTIMTGLGTHCTSPAANVADDYVRQAAREAADEIRRQRARIVELEAAIIDLKREHGSPIPDYALRRVLRDKLFSMVN